MSETEKINLVQSLIDDALMDDEQVTAYLSVAKARIMDKRHPFGVPAGAEMPVQYEHLQCELAVRLIARRGGEGQVSHGENGVTRMWASADDSDLLSRVTPCVGVFGC